MPVLSTPVGVAPEALRGVAGALCAPFDEGVWRAALQAHLCADDPRLLDGRAHAEPYSSDTCAQKVFEAWTELLDHRGLVTAFGGGVAAAGGGRTVASPDREPSPCSISHTPR